MSIVLNGTTGITTPDVDSVTGTFSGALQASGVTTNIYPLVSATAVTASGTSIDFTGIPSWVKRITVMFGNVSTNGTSNFLVQLGTSGGVTTSGYVSRAAIQNVNTNSTAGFLVTYSVAAASNTTGMSTLGLIGSNLWTGNGVVDGNNNVHSSAGSVTLGGTLDRVRITTANGTDTFDAGSINIMYE